VLSRLGGGGHGQIIESRAVAGKKNFFAKKIAGDQFTGPATEE
jgi:hypothetical protein